MLVFQGEMIGKQAGGRKILSILSDLTEKGKYVALKEELEAGMSGRNWRELEVIYLLLRDYLKKKERKKECDCVFVLFYIRDCLAVIQHENEKVSQKKKTPKKESHPNDK